MSDRGDAEGEARALELDRAHPAAFRDRFHIPPGPGGEPAIYLCGHSLGLQPRGTRAAVESELEAWARLAVRGHLEAERPWLSYHENFRHSAAALVGARPGEVVLANSLTVNLHLMLASFYRPRGERSRVLIDWPAFPSDLYAVKSHLRVRGVDPESALRVSRPRPREDVLRDDDLLEAIEREGPRLALVLLSGVNYHTGQAFDLRSVAAAAHAAGATVGFDLAHAAGNLPLELHDWGADFAVWCGYKYLNGGPGAVGGLFVHERHGRDASLPRLAGWWGHDPATRFRMHLEPEFRPQPGAAGWQLSNPPILAMAPLLTSLGIFAEAGMEALRARSVRLTAYLEERLTEAEGVAEILTPRRPERRGCQLSLRLRGEPAALQRALEARGAVCDFREPDVLRVAPCPLYNTFHEAWRFARMLA